MLGSCFPVVVAQKEMEAGAKVRGQQGLMASPQSEMSQITGKMGCDRHGCEFLTGGSMRKSKITLRTRWNDCARYRVRTVTLPCKGSALPLTNRAMRQFARRRGRAMRYSGLVDSHGEEISPGLQNPGEHGSGTPRRSRHPCVLGPIRTRQDAQELPNGKSFDETESCRSSRSAASGEDHLAGNIGITTTACSRVTTLTKGRPVHRPAFRPPDVPDRGDSLDPLFAESNCAPGSTQLGEEGAIQVFRPVGGGALLLGAVGNLQFDVVAHRLRHEYGCEARLTPARYTAARWITADHEKDLKRFIDANSHRVAHDAVDAPAFLAVHDVEIKVARELWPNTASRPARARRLGFRPIP